ncbi:MAG: PAS domain S-box protein [Candidatus Lokiarchaeota archaeon]|nr:PAS domain S-box protein [Candidatus Lokiarchaeota archaeon]MBD3201661.1 PAS domain S-box protein [Candidatus Lokiarchaeota archaeon]
MPDSMGTDNKKKNETISEEKQYYRLIDAFPFGIAIIQHSKIVYINTSAINMLEYDDCNELIGKNAVELLCQEEQSRIYDLGLEILDKQVESPIRYITTAKTKLGKKLPIETYANKIFYEGNRALQIVMINITNIVDSESNYRRILDYLADPINVLDQNLKYVYFNEPLKKWIKNLGYKADLIGKKITDVFGFLPKEMKQEYEKVFRTGETLITEDYLTIDNQEVYTETRKIPIIENNEVTNIITVVRDFTERKKILEKLKESEEKYRHLFENSPYYILLIDKNWKIIDCNKKTKEIIGYSKQELIGKNLKDIPLIPIDRKNYFVERTSKIFNGMELEPTELQIKKKDGTPIWIKSKASLMRIMNEYYIQLIGQDITESKEKEEILNINQFAIDHTLVEVYWINSEGEFEYVNRAACRKLEYTYEELLNMTVPEVDPIFTAKKYMEVWEEIKVKKHIAFETKHLTKSGKSYPVKVSSNFLNYNGRELNIAFSIDISDQKKAKLKIKNSEEKYRSLFENAPYSIFLINMEGRIEDCNQAAVDMFGFRKDEMIRSSHRELKIHPQPNITSFIERFVDLIKGEKVESIETQLHKKNGDLIWVYIHSILIKIGNKYLIQSLMQDISERKQAEEELRNLNRIKSELLKRTSHELKTPLVAIKGFTSLLIELYRDKFNKEIVSMIEEIKNGCLRLEDLITDILSTAELESGSLELKESKLNLKELIIECINELKGLIRLRKHELNLNLQDNIIITGEKKKIHDVITNLLTNAIKYTPPHGYIDINMDLTDNNVVISIKDTGIGLTDEEKSKIFTQFGKIERYGQGFDVISEGSGLGLFISKKIIELHEGSIWVESEGRNKGSTFYISLQLRKD